MNSKKGKHSSLCVHTFWTKFNCELPCNQKMLNEPKGSAHKSLLFGNLWMRRARVRGIEIISQRVATFRVPRTYTRANESPVLHFYFCDSPKYFIPSSKSIVFLLEWWKTMPRSVCVCVSVCAVCNLRRNLNNFCLFSPEGYRTECCCYLRN